MFTLIKIFSPENSLSRCNIDYRQPLLSSFVRTPTAYGIHTVMSPETKLLTSSTAVGARLPPGTRDRSLQNAVLSDAHLDSFTWFKSAGAWSSPLT